MIKYAAAHPFTWDMPDDHTMLRQISRVLQQLCDRNSAERACPTIFDSVSPPLLLPTVHCYLVRIHAYTEFDSVCFLMALSYIMRWDQHGPPIRPTHHNIHRLFITALVVASKANDGPPPVADTWF